MQKKKNSNNPRWVDKPLKSINQSITVTLQKSSLPETFGIYC